jgi:hypothetical protein
VKGDRANWPYTLFPNCWLTSIICGTHNTEKLVRAVCSRNFVHVTVWSATNQPPRLKVQVAFKDQPENILSSTSVMNSKYN